MSFLLTKTSAVRTAPDRTLRLPGVYAPQADTRLLIETVLAAGIPPGARVLDLGTGSGRIAVAVARAGAEQVVGVDISRRAVWTARGHARGRRLPVRIVRGDLFDAPEVAGHRFDLILANPPYVPSPVAPGPHSRARAWDAGRDGRALLDRICLEAPARVAPAGSLWLVHSELSDPARTLRLLRRGGLRPAVEARERIPFGPVLRERAGWLRGQGLLAPDQNLEEIVVIRARQP